MTSDVMQREFQKFTDGIHYTEFINSMKNKWIESYQEEEEEEEEEYFFSLALDIIHLFFFSFCLFYNIVVLVKYTLLKSNKHSHDQRRK